MVVFLINVLLLFYVIYIITCLIHVNMVADVLRVSPYEMSFAKILIPFYYWFY